MFWARPEEEVAPAPGWLDPYLLCGCTVGLVVVMGIAGSAAGTTSGNKVAKNSHHVTIRRRKDSGASSQHTE
jgi:hypothetical protein